MDYRILGKLEVLDESGPVEVGTGKQRSLLALLLIHTDELLQVDRIADALWEGEPPESAVKTVQVLVSRLRKAFGPAMQLETDGGGYRLRVGGARLDRADAEAAIAHGRKALAAGDSAAAAAALGEALARWRGSSLEDFRYDGFAAAEASRLDELRWSATEDRIDADLALGRHVNLLAELDRLVADHPLRERLWGQRMLALYRSGRQAEALAAYDELRRRLDEELGLAPSPALQQLQQAVLRQDSSLASPSSAGAAGSFVGRAAEMSELTRSLADTRLGHGSLVVISGEPGIGKTRLAAEFSRRVAELGGHVVWGRCWEAGGAPAYWPWVQILRSLLRASPSLEELLDHEPELAALLPELDAAASPSAEGDRFLLFDAASRFIRAAAAREPLALILDDVHAADIPSILLLEFLATALADAPVLLVVVSRPSQQTARLDRVARHTLTLRGLAADELAALLERTASLETSGDLLQSILAETGGNPLFVGELARLLVDTELTDDAWRRALLHGTSSLIARRLEELSEESIEVLEQAAVLGRDVSLPVLTAVTGRMPEALLDALAEAVSAGILEQPRPVPTEFRFKHVLFRDALYEQLKPSRRLNLHRAVGQALAELHTDDPEPFLAEIAHHCFLGAAGGDSDAAVQFGQLAAEQAQRVLAHEEAARLYEQTLRILELSGNVEPQQRCDLLLALGNAQMRSGNVTSAQNTFARTADVAERAGLSSLLARASLGYGGPFLLDRMVHDTRFVPLLERALSQLPLGTDDKLRVRLLARLGGALRRDMPERAAACSEQAVSLARTLGDPATIAYALDASFGSLWHTPLEIDRWLQTANEIIELAEAAGDAERALEGRHHRIGTLMHLGRIHEAEQDMRVLTTLAQTLRQPAELWFASVYEALLAMFRGDLDLAEDRISAAPAFAREQKMQAWDVSSMQTIQLHALRREQGRLDEIADGLEEFLTAEPSRLLYRCMLADLQLQLGRTEQARASLADLGRNGFRELAQDNEGIYAMALLGELCHALDDHEHAAALYDVLLPFDGRAATSYPEISVGAVARYLGLLALTCGRTEEAERHLRAALEQNTNMGALPWFEHARRELTLAASSLSN
jgi:DNA-binding SARP family transcriptional activator